MQTRKLTSAALLIAIGTLSAHLIYIPAGVSKCFPVQHAINVMGAVLLGPDYAVAIGFIIACLRFMASNVINLISDTRSPVLAIVCIR